MRMNLSLSDSLYAAVVKEKAIAPMNVSRVFQEAIEGELRWRCLSRGVAARGSESGVGRWRPKRWWRMAI